jgi:hypothetical protein
VTSVTTITAGSDNRTGSLAVDYSAHGNQGGVEGHRVFKVIEVIGKRRLLGGLALLKVCKGAGSTLKDAEGCLKRIGEDDPEEK